MPLMEFKVRLQPNSAALITLTDTKFLQEWAQNRNSMWFYLTEIIVSEELLANILSLLNVDANMAGCVLPASPFSCFEDNYSQSCATEKEVMR